MNNENISQDIESEQHSKQPAEQIPTEYNAESLASSRNSQRNFIVRPVYTGGAPPFSGSQGEYEIQWVFASPGGKQFYADATEVGLQYAGDSQITLVGTAPFLYPQTPNGQQFELLPNEDGHLARIKVILTAQNLEDANSTAYSLVPPVLSMIAFQFDCPLNVCARFIKEVATGVNQFDIVLPGRVKTVSLDTIYPIDDCSIEMNLLFATYREAMNSINPFYQFLCFYKVLEGIRISRGLRQRKLNKKKEIERPAEEERFPRTIEEIDVDNENPHHFTKYLGKRFGDVTDQLRGTMRNAIAHMDPKGDMLSPDDFNDIRSCAEAIPAVKFMSRRMLRNELFRQMNRRYTL